MSEIKGNEMVVSDDKIESLYEGLKRLSRLGVSSFNVQLAFDIGGLSERNEKRGFLDMLYRGEMDGYILTSSRSPRDRIAINNKYLFVENANNHRYFPVETQNKR